MKNPMIAMSAALFLAAAGAAGAADQSATASFVGKDGKPNGSAMLSQTAAGVLIEIEISGLPAGQWVAFHVHETGTCDAATHHESAGGHFNPDGRKHGLLAEGGQHAGDMPNIWVGQDGTARAQVLNTAVTLADAANGITGRALMVHAGADDYTSQPSGNAGDRLACGVIGAK
jgi:Cu-Zn family superoxide dismutase